MSSIIQDQPRTFADFAPGDVFVHQRHVQVTHAESLIFCKQTHLLEPHAVAGTDAAKRLVHPLFAFATVLGISVEDLSEAGGAFLGLDQLVFMAPVVDGASLSARSVVERARPSNSRPGWGIVTWRTTGTADDHHQPVLSYLRTNLVPDRSRA